MGHEPIARHEKTRLGEESKGGKVCYAVRVVP